MKFAETLKELRKQAGYSQEQLAEKIGVSRQAITKWETDTGLPDIENLMIIATLFSISLDELLMDEKTAYTVSDYTYESVTEYDISKPMHFDIDAPGSLEVHVGTADSEKLRIRLASNSLKNLASDYKVKLDENRNSLDVRIEKTGALSEALGKEALIIEITVPAALTNEVELTAITDILNISSLSSPLDVSGKVNVVNLLSVTEAVAFDLDTDLTINADTLPSSLEINQINATSTLHIPHNERYFTKIKGRSNNILYTLNGQKHDPEPDADATKRIELAGLNAELTIDAQM